MAAGSIGPGILCALAVATVAISACSLGDRTMREDCVESPRLASDGAIQGSAENGEVWALGGAPQVGQTFKLVARVTGEGELLVVAMGPGGSRVHPRLEAHTLSNFSRPGDEWGLFFEFQRAGCWQIRIDRGPLSGVITMYVES